MTKEVTKLYRVIGLDVFLDMTLRKELCFVHPRLWEDPHEGLLFKALADPRNHDLIKQHALKNWDSDSGSAISMLNLMPLFSNALYAQSWSRLAESDALWRIYSNGNRAIRIETDTEMIQKLDGVKCVNVEYVDLTLEEHLARVAQECFIGKTIEFAPGLKYKRVAFDHEKEVRLLSDLDPRDTIEGPRFPNEFPDILMKAKKPGTQLNHKEQKIMDAGMSVLKKPSRVKRSPPVKYISYKGIEGFIKSACVHPLADDWYVETVKKYCKREKIRFLGKSSLYS